MTYVDKKGMKIEAGMIIRMNDGSHELVYNTTDSNGDPDLGISASNEQYLGRHPEAHREFYSLRNYNAVEIEIVRAVNKN